MALSLAGSRVLVVGGSSGFGEATARQAAEAGAYVTIASRSAEKLADAAGRIGGQCRTAVLDVRDGSAIERFLSAEEPFDHIVVSAGELPPAGPLTVEHMHEQADARFWSIVHVSRSARINPHGSLTLVTGSATLRPPKGIAVLSAIGAAVNALCRGLALEMAPVRVNTVIPGPADTPLWGADAEKKAARMEQIAKGLPLGRVGTADDVAHQILACMVNPFMTGSLVVLDAGASI